MNQDIQEWYDRLTTQERAAYIAGCGDSAVELTDLRKQLRVAKEALKEQKEAWEFYLDYSTICTCVIPIVCLAHQTYDGARTALHALEGNSDGR